MPIPTTTQSMSSKGDAANVAVNDRMYSRHVMVFSTLG